MHMGLQYQGLNLLHHRAGLLDDNNCSYLRLVVNSSV